jgi:hypothetical protein
VLFAVDEIRRYAKGVARYEPLAGRAALRSLSLLEGSSGTDAKATG